jgi:hypothetical protein
MIKKLSLFLLANAFALTAFAQTTYPAPNRNYPPVNTSVACGVYNQLQAGMRIQDVQNIIDANAKTIPSVGKTYQWVTQSGYKYSLNFFNRGTPMGYVATAPLRIVFIPDLKMDNDYYGYGVITPNERKLMKLASTQEINLVVAQQLLGTYGSVIGDVYQYTWKNRWPLNSYVLTIDTDLGGVVRDFSVNAFCGNITPVVLI